jgi:hypothetical protein
MLATFDFDKIIKAAGDNQRQPVESWSPELSGDIDISIDSAGIWRHCGDEFARTEIPKLFARILCKEGQQYYLKTPVEKWRIEVADVPFYVVHLDSLQTERGIQLRFITATEDVVILDRQHPLRLAKTDGSEATIPYIKVRDDMEAKLSRNVFYQLVELAEIDEKRQQLYLYSNREKFLLGEFG